MSFQFFSDSSRDPSRLVLVLVLVLISFPTPGCRDLPSLSLPPYPPLFSHFVTSTSTPTYPAPFIHPPISFDLLGRRRLCHGAHSYFESECRVPLAAAVAAAASKGSALFRFSFLQSSASRPVSSPLMLSFSHIGQAIDVGTSAVIVGGSSAHSLMKV